MRKTEGPYDKTSRRSNPETLGSGFHFALRDGRKGRKSRKEIADGSMSNSVFQVMNAGNPKLRCSIHSGNPEGD